MDDTYGNRPVSSWTDLLVVRCMIATVDPGVSGLGWAVWNDEQLEAYGNIYADKRYTTWTARASEIELKFRQEVLLKYPLKKVYIEFPEYQTGATGHAANVKGDVLILACLIGFLGCSCLSMAIPWIPVLVSDWKGQLKKEIVELRIRKVIPDLKAKSHAVDAIGIGLWLQGKINQAGGHNQK
jgi:hypothetical protein